MPAMEQLSGLDTSFLNMETATTYGHVSGLAIYDPSTAAAPVTLERLKALIQERMHLVPLYRRRLVEVPLGLDHPYWIEDPDFDLDFHIRHIAVPPPGTPQQLSDLVSRIVARPLDRSRPLWELFLIEGLQEGYIAQLTKVHHCAIDGVSGTEILTTLLDLTPEPRRVDPPRRGWRPEARPTQVEMLARTAWGLLGAPRKVWRLQREVLRYLPELAASLGFDSFPGQDLVNRLLGRRPTPMMSEAPTKAPRMSFNGSITPHRRWAFGSISLDEVKEIKNWLGVTVNDVILAICSGALRRYLLARDELPGDPLIAMVPVSTRSEEHAGTQGNQISAMTASLHTHVEDPVERARRIHESMRVAKEQHEALPATLLQDFAQFAPPAVAARAARVIARATVANWVDPPFNVVISNVPGPQFPLYGVGAKLVGNYPVSAINDGVGLNITVVSYNGNVDWGLLSCRELMPDIWDLMDYVYESLLELKEAAKALQSSSAEPRP